MSVIVLGSLNTDLCYQLKALPRPGETLHALSFKVLNGGKGANQALAAKRAGADSIMMGFVGSDDYGQSHIDAMSLEAMSTQHIKRSVQPTGSAVIYIEQSGENTIILNAGANEETSAAQLQQYPIKADDSLVCQMEINQAETIKALNYAKNTEARTILNLAPIPDEFMDGLFNAVDYLIVNELEAHAVCKYMLAQEKKTTPDVAISAQEQAQIIATNLQLNCIITCGDKGAIACTPDEEIYAAPALPISAKDIIDTTGAGDSFTGVFAAALDRGDPLEEALNFAAIAGSLACLKLGAQSSYPTDKEIRQHLKLTAQ